MLSDLWVLGVWDETTPLCSLHLPLFTNLPARSSGRKTLKMLLSEVYLIQRNYFCFLSSQILWEMFVKVKQIRKYILQSWLSGNCIYPDHSSFSHRRGKIIMPQNWMLLTFFCARATVSLGKSYHYNWLSLFMKFSGLLCRLYPDDVGLEAHPSPSSDSFLISSIDCSCGCLAANTV